MNPLEGFCTKVGFLLGGGKMVGGDGTSADLLIDDAVVDAF
jgi:hypothetical protein